MESNAVKMLGPTGEKPTIVCLHGGPGMDSSYFLPFLEPLTDRCGLLVYDQKADPNEGMPGLLAELEAVTEAIRGQPFYVLGHSFGGAIALEYLKAMRVDEPNLKGIILVSWVYDQSWVDTFNQSFASRLDGTSEQEDRDIQYRRQSLEIADLYFDKGSLPVGKKILGQIKYNSKSRDLIWRNYQAHMDLGSYLPKVNAPVLSIVGKKDQIVTTEYVRNGANKIKDSVHIELDNAGHFPFVEQPQSFINSILQFVERTT